MKRERASKHIEQLLLFHWSILQVDGSGNLQDSAVLSESLFCRLLNMVYGWNLENANVRKRNTSGYDLIDEKGSLLVQVSKDDSRRKIEDTLDRLAGGEHGGYRLKFMFLVPKKRNYRDFPPDAIPTGLSFDPEEDIITISELMGRIRDLDVDEIVRIEDLLEREIDVNPVDPRELPSSLGKVVRALLGNMEPEGSQLGKAVRFSIDEKIELNDLGVWAPYIQALSVYTPYLSSVYDSYSSGGSSLVPLLLADLSRAYIERKRQGESPAEVFSRLHEDLMCHIDGDEIVAGIEDSSLSTCVDIVLVDAFMRCRTFEGPDVFRQATREGDDDDTDI